MTAVASKFLDSFQFVEPAGSRSVPNHLLDTKIYAKLAQNSVVKVSPPVIHFEGFEVGKSQSCKISLCNVAREVIRMHINPPQTKHFGLHYTKQMRLVPGMTLDCTVEFVADEWRYYYDCIKIHCPGDENIVIPIHAYPAMDMSEFPQQITFPLTALGSSRSKIIPLRSKVPVDFEFELTMLEASDAYRVDPQSGVVPANGEIDIAITYAPTAYATAVMILQLVVSQFNSKPRPCRVVGQCTPNLNRAVVEVDEVDDESASRVYSPLDRTRVRRQKTAALAGKPFLQQFTKSAKVERDGLYFTNRLDTVHHVSQVLIQTPGKMQLKELLAETKAETNSRQLKETRFEQAVRKNVYEERQNQLRWQVNLGAEQMSMEEKARVLAEREAERQTYRDACGEPHAADELRRKSSEFIWARTIRKAGQPVLGKDILFDLYSNNPWDIRHVACHRFAQAARKIIMRNRAKKNLSMLEHFVLEWRRRQLLGRNTTKQSTNKDTAAASAATDTYAASDGSTAAAVTAATIADTPVEDDNVDESSLKKYRVSINVGKVTHTKHPHYVQPNKKDDMAPDALSEVVTYPTEVETEIDVPFFDLKVPQQYRLLGYEPHDVHDAYGYVAPTLPRRLRLGALDEVINLDTSAVSVAADDVATGRRAEDAQQRLPQKGAQLSAASSSQATLAAAPRASDERRGEAQVLPTSTAVELKPPSAMFEAIEYPPLHIFNATPGLQVFQAPAPYSEVDPDFHLCPLPRYTAPTDGFHSATQKKYLDREDVIKGVMSWKKFPSNGLVTLANNPTLTNVWVPRWTDPFDTELLPLAVPELQGGLAPEDALDYANELDAEADEKLLLTPEMVSAQFPQIAAKAAAAEEKESGDAFPFGAKMPATNLPVSSEGPLPRELREQELDYFLSKKSNKLGAKMQAKMELYNGLKHDSELVLK